MLVQRVNTSVTRDRLSLSMTKSDVLVALLRLHRGLTDDSRYSLRSGPENDPLAIRTVGLSPVRKTVQEPLFKAGHICAYVKRLFSFTASGCGRLYGSVGA